MLSVVAAPATAVRAFAAATLGRTISTAGARPAVAVVAVVAPPGVTPVVPAAVVPGCSCRRVGAVSRPQWAEAWLCARTVVSPLPLLRRGRTQRCSAGSRNRPRSAGRLARTAHRRVGPSRYPLGQCAALRSAPRVCGGTAGKRALTWTAAGRSGCWRAARHPFRALASARFLGAPRRRGRGPLRPCRGRRRSRRRSRWCCWARVRLADPHAALQCARAGP